MIFPPFPEPGFRKLSDLQSGIDSYYTADQLKKYGLKCVEEYKRCQSKQEWDIRGDLASSLKCWHRLTGAEAQNLIDFFANNIQAAQPVLEPLNTFDFQVFWNIAREQNQQSLDDAAFAFARAIEAAHGIGVSK
jgi:hypothetical protein